MLNRLNTEGGEIFEELKVYEAAGWGDESIHLESVLSMLEQVVDGWEIIFFTLQTNFFLLQ